MKKIRLLWLFYRNFYWLSFIVDIGALVIFLKYGYSTFAPLFWFKLLTLGITFFIIDQYKHKEYYYYRNAGLSKRQLWIATLFFDILLFLIIITQVYKLKGLCG